MSVPETRNGADAANGRFDDADELAHLQLGSKLKTLRRQRGLTLEAVSRGTQLSVSFLNLLENNKSDASLARLQRIAHFYDLNINDLFADETREVRRVVRLSDAVRVEYPKDGIVSMSLAVDPRRSMDPFCSIMEPGMHYVEPAIHPGEEFRHVLEGHLRVHIGEEPAYDLYPGDTIYHPSGLPHYYENAGDCPLQTIGCTLRPPIGVNEPIINDLTGDRGEHR